MWICLGDVGTIGEGWWGAAGLTKRKNKFRRSRKVKKNEGGGRVGRRASNCTATHCSTFSKSTKPPRHTHKTALKRPREDFWRGEKKKKNFLFFLFQPRTC